MPATSIKALPKYSGMTWLLNPIWRSFEYMGLIDSRSLSIERTSESWLCVYRDVCESPEQ